MKKIKLIVTLASILLLAVTVVAQEEEEEEEKWRNFEVSVHGGLTQPGEFLSDWKDTLGAKMGFNVALSGGYYFNNNFCAGLYGAYSQMTIEGDWDRIFRMYDFGAYGKYALIGESNFEPYGKIALGVITPKYPTWIPPGVNNQLREQSFDPGMSAALYAGLLYYTSDNGGIFFEAGYHNDFLKDVKAEYADATIAENIKYFEFRLGITVFYGSDE
jgi:hypothetical protein